MKKVLSNILTGYGMFCIFLLIDNAPVGAYYGLTVLTVIVIITMTLFLSAARRAMRKPSQHYHYYTRADYPSEQVQTPTVEHSNAMDYASNPWLYGKEDDSRSHAYHAKQYRQREADARQAAYENQKRHDERTRELKKWKVADE